MENQETPARVLVDDVAMAKSLGVSVSWLRKDRITHQRVPFVRLGGRCLYDPARVKEAMRGLEFGGRA